VKRIRRSWLVPLILWSTLSGCATGSVLTVPGELSLKTPQPPPNAAVPPAVAVLDFSWSGTSPSNEIGRDFDHARPIVWNGDPGKSMADLIAGLLLEKGIAAVRAPGELYIPANVPAKVWGSVGGFHVDVKRVGTIKVELEAAVSLKIQGTGPGFPAGWSNSISSTYGDTDLFSTPEGVYQALNRAANAAAEEAVRRLLEAGVVSAPK